jgi:hypothetical protein
MLNVKTYHLNFESYMFKFTPYNLIIYNLITKKSIYHKYELGNL